MPEKTKRLFDVYAKAETRAAGDGKKYIEGVIPYNSRSEEMWGFVEVIAPTAFNKTLSDSANVYAFWGHDEKRILGATQSATLKLEPRDDGLHFSVELRDTAEMEDYFQTIARGDCNGVSFGFIAEKESWDNTQEPALRTLTEVRLLEVSPGVAFPAYPGAQSEAAKRSLYAEGAPEFRSKYIKPAEPLTPTPEPPEALESRKKAEEEELRKRQEVLLAAILAPIGL
jgi:uncharacterized protein